MTDRRQIESLWPGCHRRGRRWLAALVAAGFGLATSGCGTIIHGTRMDLKNQVTPAGATLDVYRWQGERLAGQSASPADVDVHRPIRHESYLVRASKPGHCPQYWLTTSPITGGSWLYLWMMFIPALGPILVAGTFALIDANTGGCCGIEPHDYTVALAEDYACPE